MGSPRRVASFGECMLELQGQAFGTMQQTYGGDTLNTAVYLARCGARHGLRVVYAPHDLVIGDGVRWPGGCTDLPAVGSLIAKATPVCTAHAAGHDENSVRTQLQQRHEEVLYRIAPSTGAVATDHNNDLVIPRRSA